jgi:hypothetical protein
MKHTILFLLIPLFAFSQSKSEQVKAYLGESKYMDVPISGKVNFVFQKGTLTRVSDGKKSFSELLPDGVGYSDADNAGKLKGITENGVLIRPYVPVKSAVVPESARPFSMPKDSMQWEETFEEVNRTATFWESQMWKFIRPMWGTVMHIFWIAFPILLGLIGTFWFLTSWFASEEFASMHYWSSKILVCLIGTVFIIFFWNTFLSLVYQEMNVIGLVFCTFILAGIALWTGKKLVRNYKQIPGGRPPKDGNWYPVKQ